MKNIYLIGGPMGVGKTSVSLELVKQLPNSVLLDGDWCWNSNPLIVNEETKRMVIENICFLLNQFISSKSYENIVFCWVMDHQSIIDSILAGLKDEFNTKIISLLCSDSTLISRLRKDIDSGSREETIIERSLARLPLYEDIDSVKIYTNNKTIKEIVREIVG